MLNLSLSVGFSGTSPLKLFLGNKPKKIETVSVKVLKQMLIESLIDSLKIDCNDLGTLSCITCLFTKAVKPDDLSLVDRQELEGVITGLSVHETEQLNIAGQYVTSVLYGSFSSQIDYVNTTVFNYSFNNLKFTPQVDALISVINNAINTQH